LMSDVVRRRSFSCMAGTCAQPALRWRTTPIVRHQQTGRPLFAHVDDTRRPSGSVGIRTSRPWRSPTRMLASSGPCSPGISLTNRRDQFRRLDTRRLVEGRTEVLPGNCNHMIGDGETFTPLLPEPGGLPGGHIRRASGPPGRLSSIPSRCDGGKAVVSRA